MACLSFYLPNHMCVVPFCLSPWRSTPLLLLNLVWFAASNAAGITHLKWKVKVTPRYYANITNVAAASSATIFNLVQLLLIDPPFTLVDAGRSTLVSGRAYYTFEDLLPVDQEQVTVYAYIGTSGQRRQWNTVTDGRGFFSVTVEGTLATSGTYQLGAKHPNTTDSLTTHQLKVVGMDVTPKRIHLKQIRGYNNTFEVLLCQFDICDCTSTNSDWRWGIQDSN